MSTNDCGSGPSAPAPDIAQRVISRRALLKGAAGAALPGLAGAATVRAQFTGISPGGGVIPFRLPLGAMNYLDLNQYISNMKVISFLPEHSTAGGEPLLAMWAKGRQRLLPSGAGWVDVSDPANPTFLTTGKHRIGGCVAYNTKLKKWLMVATATEPHAERTPTAPSDSSTRRSTGGCRATRVRAGYACMTSPIPWSPASSVKSARARSAWAPI